METNKLYRGLPLWEARIDGEDCGMLAISIVDDPATEVNFLKFSKDKEIQKFKIQNEEKRIVRGLVMEANKPIYRIGTSGYEYFVIYRPETIRKMAERYLKNGLQNSVDLNHNNIYEENCNMTQFFIKDVNAGIDPAGFEEVSEGSLFVEFHIENDSVWEQIREGKFKGFSLYGLFDVEPILEEQFKKNTSDDVDDAEILALIEKIENKLLKNK